MPPAPDHWQVWSDLFDESRELQSVTDGWSGQRRYANAKEPVCDPADLGTPVDIPFRIDNLDIVACVTQQAGKRQMRQRRHCAVESASTRRGRNKVRRVQ